MHQLLHYSRPHRWQDAEARLTPAELFADEIRRSENRERYVQQSANTQAGARAEIPARQSLSRVGE